MARRNATTPALSADCTSCVQPSHARRLQHWLSLGSQLGEHLRGQGDEDKAASGSVLGYVATIRDLYRGRVEENTGAPISTWDAWLSECRRAEAVGARARLSDAALLSGSPAEAVARIAADTGRRLGMGHPLATHLEHAAEWMARHRGRAVPVRGLTLMDTPGTPL